MNLARRIWRECLWQFVTKTLRLLFALVTKIRIVNYGEIPRHRGFILASNHISHFDPPILTPLFPRRIDWIAMSDLFRGRLLDGLFSGLNVIPIERKGPDRAALRTAVKRLKEGRVVGIFPEGGIRDGAASIVNGAEMKQGVTVLSQLADAPVVPCVILGSDRLYNPRNWLPWRRTPVWIGYGAPIQPTRDDREKSSKDSLGRVLSLEIVKLKERLCQDFRLTAADLPHSPRQRMQEP